MGSQRFQPKAQEARSGTRPAPSGARPRSWGLNAEGRGVGGTEGPFLAPAKTASSVTTLLHRPQSPRPPTRHGDGVASAQRHTGSRPRPKPDPLVWFWFRKEQPEFGTQTVTTPSSKKIFSNRHQRVTTPFGGARGSRLHGGGGAATPWGRATSDKHWFPGSHPRSRCPRFPPISHLVAPSTRRALPHSEAHVPGGARGGQAPVGDGAAGRP